MRQHPTLLGLVQDVEGSTVGVQLDESTIAGLIFVAGKPHRVGQVGSFVRIPLGYVDLIGVVSLAGASAIPEHFSTEERYGTRWLRVDLVGTASSDGGFSRGLSQLPSIDDAVHLVTEDELSSIYGHVDSEELITVGQIASSDGIPGRLNANSLVTRHVAVVGATGSGKSTTVSQILRALTDEDRYPSARVVMFDLHGEYGNSLADRSVVFSIDTGDDQAAEPLHVPYWALTFDELLPLTLGELDSADRGAIRDMILALKRASLATNDIDTPDASLVTADTPVPFSIHQLWLDLHTLINGTHTKPASAQTSETLAYELDDEDQPIQVGDPMLVIPPRFRPQNQRAGEDKIYLSGSDLNISRNVDTLASRLRDKRLDFLFRPGPWLPRASDGRIEADLDIFLQKWIGSRSPVCILNLSGVPSTVVIPLVGALSRVLYDALFWAQGLSEGGRARPLLFVFEEAHSYLSKSGKQSAAGESVQRIVKEGRKYGVGAMIVSQRPSEIDSTILSQCGTLIAMRLSNTTDRNQVGATVADSLSGMLDMLPVLRTGEAIITGEAVPLPMRVLIPEPPLELLPDSRDARVVSHDPSEGWNRDRDSGEYAKVLESWRRQDSMRRTSVDGATTDEEGTD